MHPQRLYLMATAAWFMAFGMQAVVFAWLVTIVLREPAELVGWAQTALLIPGMLFILVAGSLADRIGPDRQAMLAQSFAAFTPWLLFAAAWLGWLSFGVMVVYAVLMGIAQAFVTPARDGLLNHVAEGRVQRTVMLTSLFQFGFQIVGYFVAGFADAVGVGVMLALQSVVLLVGVLGFALIVRSGVVVRDPAAHRSVLAGVVEGARTTLGSSVMRLVVLQNVAMACFFMGSFVVCFPLVIREVFDGSSGDLAVLNACNALGLVSTIVVMLRLGDVRRPGRALLLSQGIGAVVLGSAGLMTNFPLFVLAVFCWGLCGGLAIPMSRTLMQELAPPEQRARVMSFHAFSFMGAGPLGTLFCGYLAELYGPQLAIVICGVGMLTVVLLMGATSSLWATQFEPAVASTGEETADVDDVPSTEPGR